MKRREEEEEEKRREEKVREGRREGSNSHAHSEARRSWLGRLGRVRGRGVSGGGRQRGQRRSCVQAPQLSRGDGTSGGVLNKFRFL